MELTYIDYDASHWLLALFYGILSLVVFSGLVRLRYHRDSEKKYRFWLNLMFYVCVLSGAISRLLYFLAIVAFKEDWWEFDHLLLFTLIDLPTLFFLTAYSIVLYYWADLYHSKVQSVVFTSEVLLSLGVLINAVAYVVCLALIWIDLFVYHEDAFNKSNAVDGAQSETWAEMLVNLVIAAFYFLFSVTYLLYGWQAVVLYREVPVVTPERKAVLRRLMMMVSVIPICFIIRTPITIIGMFYSFSALWWFDLPYYSALEIAPLLIMMYVLLYKPQS